MASDIPGSSEIPGSEIPGTGGEAVRSMRPRGRGQDRGQDRCLGSLRQAHRALEALAEEAWFSRYLARVDEATRGEDLAALDRVVSLLRAARLARSAELNYHPAPAA